MSLKLITAALAAGLVASAAPAAANAARPALRISDVTVTEGDGGAALARFTVRLSRKAPAKITVKFATVNQSAVGGLDYIAKRGTLVFKKGQRTKRIDVSVLGDTADEPNKTFAVALSAPRGARLADKTGVATILDNDAASQVLPSGAAAISIANTTVAEQTGNVASATFTISLSHSSTSPVTVQYLSTNGTALAGTDYTAVNGSVAFIPGETSKQVHVEVAGDVLDEHDEAFFISLHDAANATLANAVGAGTIVDDDAAPTVGVDGGALSEGDSGTKSALFTVDLSQASGKTVTVGFETSDGTATATSDYASSSGTLTFAAGETEKTVAVPVHADTTDEEHEHFDVTLQNAVNAVIQAGPRGKLDIVVANAGADTVSVLLGNGDGSFDTTAEFAASDGPESLSLGDVNDDGDLDIAVANSGSNTVSILLGRGNGTFGTKVDYPTGSVPFAVEVADLSGDGAMDLAVTNLGSDTVSVLLGNGDGTFDEDVEYAVGGGPESLAAADLNVDGKLDLAVANNNSHNVSILLGNGDGTFQAKTDYPAAGGPESVAVGDLNSDGKLDLAIAAASPGPNRQAGVSVLLGNGDGTFQAKTDYAQGPGGLQSIALGDVNDDGKLDAAFTNGQRNRVSVMLGNGDGTFQTPVHHDLGFESHFPVSLALGDLNGDSKLDIAVTNLTASGPDSVSILRGNGDGTFQPKVDYAVGASPNFVVLGDINSNDASGTAGAVIVDDDAPPSLSVNDRTVTEPQGADPCPPIGNFCPRTTVASFTVTLSAPSGKSVSITYATADDTATAGSDYIATTGSLTFGPGELTKTISVTVRSDGQFGVDEDDETFVVNLSSAGNATIADDQGVGTIAEPS